MCTFIYEYICLCECVQINKIVYGENVNNNHFDNNRLHLDFWYRYNIEGAVRTNKK